MKIDPYGYKLARWLFVLVVLSLWFFTVILIKDSFKTREDFQVLTGKVVEKGDTIIKGMAISYVYYFVLSNHEQPLGIVTNKYGEPTLDMSFKGVNVNDIIKVTYEENLATNKAPVNLIVHEIVRNGEILYNNIPSGNIWNGKMKLGLGSFIISLFPIALLVLFERKYKKAK